MHKKAAAKSIIGAYAARGTFLRGGLSSYFSRVA